MAGPDVKIVKKHYSRYNEDNLNFVKDLVDKHRNKTNRYKVVTETPVVFEELKDFTILY